MDRIEFERIYGDVLPKRFWYGYIALQQADDFEDVLNAHTELLDCAFSMLKDKQINCVEYHEIYKFVNSVYSEKLHPFFK